jgi:hypothetical protein
MLYFGEDMNVGSIDIEAINNVRRYREQGLDGGLSATNSFPPSDLDALA